MNKMKKIGLASVMASTAGVASAAVPEGITTALTTAGTDAATVGAAVFVVIVGIFAIKILRKAL